MSNFNIAIFFQSLAGRWAIRRFIPNYAYMQGNVHITPATNEINMLFYQEKGKVYIEATQQTLICHKEYVYRYHPKPKDIISIYFAKGEKSDKLFHTLKFSINTDEILAQGIHHCKQDSYHSIYRFIDKDNFEVIHTVKGPKKNYLSHTFFGRIKR